MKDKITYSEKYKKPWAKHKNPPEFNSVDMKCTEAYCLEAGRVIHNGKEMEYQIIKVYFEEK